MALQHGAVTVDGWWPIPNDRGATFTFVAVWPRCHLDAASHVSFSRGFGGFECETDSGAREGEHVSESMWLAWL